MVVAKPRANCTVKLDRAAGNRLPRAEKADFSILSQSISLKMATPEQECKLLRPRQASVAVTDRVQAGGGSGMELDVAKPR